jgi:acyl-CoA synthetase (AMP-forming)/AMP-acid ligase II
MALLAGTLHEVATGRSWSPGRLAAEISIRRSRNRAAGVERGHRVLLLADNTLEFFAELLACWLDGAAAVPVDAAISRFELDRITAAAEPRLIVATGQGDPPANAPVPVLSSREAATQAPDESLSSRLCLDDDALILFTSGSTGQPKGVVHTHRSLAARWHSLRQALGTDCYRRTLCLLPVHFGHGLICNCLFPLLSGCDLYLGPAFTPAFLAGLGRAIDEHRITAMSSVPTLWRVALRLARPPEDRSLRRVHCGSAPLSADLWRKISDWTGGVEVVNSYGITETGSWLAGSLGAGAPSDGLIGWGWGTDLRVLRTAEVPPGAAEPECAVGETGYVWAHTAALMKGYFRRDDLTASAVRGGWFFTGDMGFRDEAGRILLGGRAVDEINKGGMKIQPQDVEIVAGAFEHAADVCVFAAPDELYGQNIAIAFVLGDPRPEVLAAFYRWVEARLSRHKMPAFWYRLEELPRTARGKIHRSQVAELCRALQPVDWRTLA